MPVGVKVLKPLLFFCNVSKNTKTAANKMMSKWDNISVKRLHTGTQHCSGGFRGGRAGAGPPLGDPLWATDRRSLKTLLYHAPPVGDGVYGRRSL